MICTLDGLLRESARRWPQNAALVDEIGHTLSYHELEKNTDGLFQSKPFLALSRGERAAVLSRNTFQSVAVYFAILRTGAAVIWLNHSLDFKDLAEIAKDAGISILFHEDEFKGKADRIGAECGVGTVSIESLKPSGPVHPRTESDLGANDLAAIVYTSGSTDRPLGVMLTHRNLLSNNEAIADYLNLSQTDRVACVLPFYYIYGLSLLLSHFMVGGAVILENRFSYPLAALDGFEAQKATGFSGVSSHFILLMNHTDFLSRTLPDLRYLTHAGDKMPVMVTEKLLKAFPDKKLFLMYGQTEAAPRISYLDPSLAQRKPASAGKALKNIELRVLDTESKACPTCEEGEIVIRGENVMKGYWNNPEETGKVLKEGWLFTGDTGYLDEDGDLFVTGRNKQFIKVGGRRVSPAEVESLALEYAGVLEAAVTGIPDETLGEKLRLYVVEKGEGFVDPASLIDFFKKKAPSYKVPAEVLRVAALPRTSQGKIDRKRLMDLEALA